MRVVGVAAPRRGPSRAASGRLPAGRFTRRRRRATCRRPLRRARAGLFRRRTPRPRAAALPMQQNIRRVLYVMLLGVAVYGAFAVWRGLGKMGATLAAVRVVGFRRGLRARLGNYVLRLLKWEFYLARLEIRGVPKAGQLSDVPLRLRPDGHAGQGRRGLQVARPLRDPWRADARRRRRSSSPSA